MGRSTIIVVWIAAREEKMVYRIHYPTTAAPPPLRIALPTLGNISVKLPRCCQRVHCAFICEVKSLSYLTSLVWTCCFMGHESVNTKTFLMQSALKTP